MNFKMFIGLIEAVYNASYKIENDILTELSSQTTAYFEETTENKRKTIIEYINNNLDNITKIANETEYKGTKLLDGTFSKELPILGTRIEIKKALNAENLGLISNTLETDISTEEGYSQYISKIENANSEVSCIDSPSYETLLLLEVLQNFYDQKSTVLVNQVNEEQLIAKYALLSIKDALEWYKYFCNTYWNSSEEVSNIEKVNIIGTVNLIDEISNKATFKQKNLLDGTFNGISKINSTTLGGGTKLKTTFQSESEVTSAIQQCQKAITMLENELAKL